MASLATAVATAAVVLTAAFALHVLELVHDVLENEHEGAVGDEVAPAAVTVLTEEVVEPAASALLVEVCFACLDLGIIDLVCHDRVNDRNDKSVLPAVSRG